LEVGGKDILLGYNNGWGKKRNRSKQESSAVTQGMNWQEPSHVGVGIRTVLVSALALATAASAVSGKTAARVAAVSGMVSAKASPSVAVSGKVSV